MAKTSIQETCFCINIVILCGLLYLCYVMRNKNLTEGISNMNCCGGIEAGVHYSETDRKPPDYVKRCFKSRDDNGETVYDWNGFPCTNKDSSDCCDSGRGECVATSKGGYCKGDGENFIFRRRSDQPRPYIKRSNDNILDVNDARDMQDYFYERRTDSRSENLSPEMARFMARRSKNESFVEDQVVSNAATKEKLKREVQEKREDQLQSAQIVYYITIIHLIALVIIAIVIRRFIIAKIQGYVDVIHVQYIKFSGKSMK